MVALDGDFAYSFLLGIAAAVNPCGFVMLPAFLSYFLGSDDGVDDQRAGVRRALVVSSALAAGFIGVFLVVGAITRLFTTWLLDQSKWAGLSVGVLMICVGISMLLGWAPALSTARLAPGVRTNRSVLSMGLYGVAYAVASIGCTLPLLVSAIFGSYGRRGYLSGVVSTALYGLGMALLVSALTVALAIAKVSLVHHVRKVMPYVQTASAVVMIVTGSYLAWYWYGGIYRVGETDRITSEVEGWQGRVHTWLQDRGATALAVVLGGVVAGAALFALRRRTSQPPPEPGGTLEEGAEAPAHVS